MKKVLFVMRGSIEPITNADNAPEAIDLNQVQRRKDGAAMFSVRPMRSGDYQYLAIEVPQVANKLKRDGLRWDTVLTGRIEQREVRRVLSQFEGLPVTNEHIFIGAQNKEQIAGHVLKRGKFENDGHVLSRLVIESSDLLAEIEGGEKVEVSIGFYADPPEINEANEQDDEPDFFIRNIELNHLAVVKRGRAGRKARLSHGEPLLVHGFNSDFFKGDNTMKIKINNVEFDLPEEAVDAINAERGQSSTQLENTQKQLGDANADLATVRGENAALQSQIDEAGSIEDKAAKLLSKHNDLADMLKQLGSDTEITFGQYDATEVLREALSKAGVKGMENQDYSTLCGAYAGFVGANKSKQGTGALEGDHSNPVTISHSEKSDRGQSRVSAMIHGKFFGGNKPQEAKDES